MAEEIKKARKLLEIKAKIYDAIIKEDLPALVEIRDKQLEHRKQDSPEYTKLCKSMDFVINGLNALLIEEKGQKLILNDVRVAPLTWFNVHVFLNNHYEINKAKNTYETDPYNV